jgi:RNA polymerase sigma factor for flagellar operon FliA
MNTTRMRQQELIDQGQGLVRALAAKIYRNCPPGVEQDDLVAYGEIGLAEAARDFDPSQGCRFTTFAYYRVRGAIYDGLSKMSWTSRSRYNRLRYRQLANESLQADVVGAGDQERYTAEQNASWLGSVTEKLAVVYFATRGEPGGGLRDSTVEDPMPSAASMVAQQELGQKLRELVDALPGVERSLIQAMYFEGQTLQDAAAGLGLSKSWGSRLHARALERLARLIRNLGMGETA